MALRGITIKTVVALKPGETIWDAGHKEAVKGFGARRQRDVPVYVIKYRFFGRQRFITIGQHGRYTPEKARREAKRLLGLVASGKDPQAEKLAAQARAADTVGNIAADYLRRTKKRQKPRSYIETERHLLINWKPLHSVSVFHLHRQQVAGRITAIETERGAVSAARARAALSAMFNWAIREGREVANPVFGTNRPSEPKSRSRVLSDTELAAIWSACRDDDHGRIVKLLALTGQRRDEVGSMKWAEIDQDKKAWIIPGDRTKNRREHIVPLPDSVLMLISKIPPREDRDFIFGDGARRHGDKQCGFSGWSRAKKALNQRVVEGRHKSAEDNGETMSKVTPVPDWRLHDLRRTVATIMADRLGVLPHIIEAVLNHVSGHKSGVAGVYNRATYVAEKLAALTLWADHLYAVVEGTAVNRAPKLP